MRNIIVVGSAFISFFLFSGLIYVILPTQILKNKLEIDQNHLNLYKSEKVMLTNTQYLEKYNETKRMSIEDTEELGKLTGFVSVIPRLFGYPKEMADRIFPYYEYPDCAISAQKTPGSYVSLDYKDSTLRMGCPKGKGRYVTGPIFNVTFTNSVELLKYWNVLNYNQPVNISQNADWVIASCETNNKFELHQHYPRFKSYSYRRALYYRTKMVENTNKMTEKPLMVLMLTGDSFSRRHFFRKMSKTVNFINDLNQNPDWKVFDFKIHNIIGSDTAENQSRIFGTRFNGFEFEKNLNTDLFGKDAIWSKFIRSGFVTMLGFDPCAFKMHRVIGRMPKADHVSNSFFCANARFSSYKSKKRHNTQQRCIGPYMSHYYLMNYTLSFSELYRGQNQWAYNHYGAAHEATGQHAQTLDKDMTSFLNEYISRFSNSYNIVIFLMADHGMRYGNFLSNSYAIQEHRLPAFFLIGQKSFLDSIEYSYDTLTHNTERLVTKPDIRRTLLFLAGYPYGASREPRTDKFVNLFTEKIEDDRKCEDVEIPPWYCSADVLEPIPAYFYNFEDPFYATRNSTEKELGDLVIKIGFEIVSLLNQNVYTPAKYFKGNLCKRLTYRDVSLAIFNRRKDHEIIFKLIVRVNESEAAQFDSWVLISQSSSAKRPNGEIENYEPFPVVYEGTRLFAKLINVFRADKYGGICEDLAREAMINPEHCLCRDELIKEAELIEDDQEIDNKT